MGAEVGAADKQRVDGVADAPVDAREVGERDLALPGENGVNSFETWAKEGVWFKKPYVFRQVRGEFFKWDGKGYNKPMTAAEVTSRRMGAGMPPK